MPPGWPDEGVALSWGSFFLLLVLVVVTGAARVDKLGEETPILLSRATTLLKVRGAILNLERCFYGQI